MFHGQPGAGGGEQAAEGGHRRLLAPAGPNGAGKTTAIRALLGLAAPSAGFTELLGERPGTPGFAAAVRRVGALIEGPRALRPHVGAAEHAHRGRRARAGGRRRADRGAARAGRPGRSRRYPRADVLHWHEAAARARAGAAGRAPPCLDEPTNGLDPAGIVEIRKLIKELPARGTTVLVSSHQLAEVELMCDRAMILHRGRLLAEGTIAELLARHGGAGYATRVAAHEAERAAEVLRGIGFTVTPKDDGRLAVAGEIDDGAQISRSLSEGGIHVRELWHEGARLEGVFLALTGDGDEDEAGAALAEVNS